MTDVFAALLYDVGLQQLPNRENVSRHHRGLSLERKCSGSDQKQTRLHLFIEASCLMYIRGDHRIFEEMIFAKGVCF